MAVVVADGDAVGMVVAVRVSAVGMAGDGRSGTGKLLRREELGLLKDPTTANITTITIKNGDGIWRVRIFRETISPSMKGSTIEEGDSQDSYVIGGRNNYTESVRPQLPQDSILIARIHNGKMEVVMKALVVGGDDVDGSVVMKVVCQLWWQQKWLESGRRLPKAELENGRREEGPKV
ncbi:hypothetical protein Tco_1367832 [Tanacetum coccineum]